MEMMMVKQEETQGRRRALVMVDGEVQSPRCVKRRRRDTAVTSLGCDDNQSQQQQNDQISGAAATTVKRSSRFRGVSR